MTFTCDQCGTTYEKGWSDEEAETEPEREFPGLRPEDRAVVCDDCYHLLLIVNNHRGGRA